jgi:2,3-bisphosphoglycerate-independent phosphoglycerate mutase
VFKNIIDILKTKTETIESNVDDQKIVLSEADSIKGFKKELCSIYNDYKIFLLKVREEYEESKFLQMIGFKRLKNVINFSDKYKINFD